MFLYLVNVRAIRDQIGAFKVFAVVICLSLRSLYAYVCGRDMPKPAVVFTYVCGRVCGCDTPMFAVVIYLCLRQ